MATTHQTREPAAASPIDGHRAPTAGTAGRSGWATAALAVGIVAVLAALIPILGVILGVIALALGQVSRDEVRQTGKNNLWMAIAGLALGVVAIAASIAVFALNVVASVS